MAMSHVDIINKQNTTIDISITVIR